MSDYSEKVEVEKRLRNSIRQIHNLTVHVGHAKQVREYDTDRRKNLLAKYVVPLLKAGERSTASEMHARANPAYQSELEALATQYEASEKTIAEWSSAMATYEAARSLLSMAKETLKTIE